jgi:hypothetical protein
MLPARPATWQCSKNSLHIVPGQLALQAITPIILRNSQVYQLSAANMRSANSFDKLLYRYRNFCGSSDR